MRESGAIQVGDLRRVEVAEPIAVLARGMRDNPLHVAAYGDDPDRRLRCHARLAGFRSAYPARQEFELHRTIGCHDLWVNEYAIRYDDRPVRVVGIMEFRDGKVVRERIYFGEPWELPEWRAQWVERMEPEGPVAPA